MNITLNKELCKLLYRLWRREKIGGAHIPADSLLKGFDRSHLDKVKDAVEDLIKIGLLKKKPTAAGLHYEVNENLIAEFKELILQCVIEGHLKVSPFEIDKLKKRGEQG